MSRIHFAGVYTAEIQKKVTIKNRINEILHISQSLLVAPPLLKISLPNERLTLSGRIFSTFYLQFINCCGNRHIAYPFRWSMGCNNSRNKNNTNTKKFHIPECPSVGDMSEKNRDTFTGDRETLIEKGYVPCGRCKP